MYRVFILFLTRATMSPRLRTATRLILGTCLWAASAGVAANEFFNTREAAGAACHAERARLQPPLPTCSQLRCDLFSETSDEGQLIGPGYVLTSTCLGWTRIVDFFLYPRTACGPEEDFVAPGVCVAASGGGEGDKDLGCSAAGRAVGNPCDAATGNKYQSEDDHRSGDGLLGFTRHYNSGLGQDIGLGMGWTSSVHTGLELSGTDVVIRQATGRGEPFTCNGTGACSGDPDTKLLLDQDATGYTLTLPDGATERYDPDGRRLAETDRSGKSTSYSYDVAGRLQAVTGPFGRRLTFAYDAAGHLTSMSDPAGEAYTYTYDANDNLTRVTYPDGTVRSYHYEDSAFAHHLTGITDANGDRVATYAYDTNGKAILTQRAGGQEQFTLSYDSDTQSTVTDAIGTQEVLTFAETLGVKNLLSRINQSDDKGITQVFDDNNNLIEATDAEGRITTYTYNANNQRLTMTAAAGTPEARTTTFAYVSEDIDLPTEVTTPSVAVGQQRRVTTVYNANNNPIAITQAGFTPSGAPVTRTITMAYNALGQVTEIDGARTDVADITALEYYECTTGAECGELKRITNAAGHKTTYEAYDAHGRVMRLTDPNAVVTTFTYDLRGRVLSITRTPPVGPPRTTTHTYDGAGQLLSVTTADGITLTYAYDAAGNLIAITDNLNNRIEYAYDLKGNRIREETKDPDGRLVRLIDNDYDMRNRLTQINAAGSLTQMLNDAVGNLVSQTNPNANPPTAQAYDALNRLIETVDALGGQSGYGYDVNDRITQVSAPNNATTAYVYDDVGNLLQEQSPDRGQIVNTHDAAGNVLSATDARGITATYSYDALNRITVIDYPGTEEDVTFTYDTCLKGIARICTVRDESGTTRLSYDPYGNVVQQVHTELGIDYTTAYSYDAGDRMLTMTYPGGRLVTYTRDALGRITAVSTTVDGNSTALLAGLTYRADGLLTGQTFGNGLNETRAYDQQGRLISQLLGGADNRAYEYDANGNVIGKQTVPAVASYSYDPLDRLDAETVTNGSIESIDYSYDPSGNRLSVNEAIYTYAPSSNRLSTIDGSTVTLDAAGNTLRDTTGRSFTYNAAGWLAQAVPSGSTVATYTYNFQGQRTRKVTSSGTTVYHYDRAGHLIAETDGAGETLNQYVLVNGLPVAAFARGTAPGGVFRFAGTDGKTGDSATVTLDTEAQTLSIDEQNGLNGEFHPERWQLDETSKTLTLFHRLPRGGWLAGSFDLGARPPHGILTVKMPLWLTAFLPAGARAGYKTRYTLTGQAVIAYLHTDHLNTPRLATNDTGTVVWRWAGDAFGATPPDDDPDADGIAVTVNLRFPGQYYDQETGLYYNWNRYYDPKIGRYITSDPIGLDSGLNTYAYVFNNPLRFTDPLGLYGTTDCSFYEKRCEQVGGIYYCTLAKQACKRWPSYPWGDCVRQCLQELDVGYCKPDNCGGGADTVCAINIHQMCFLQCRGGDPPSPDIYPPEYQ